MHPTNQSTLNGRMTTQQQTKIRKKVWKWLIYKYKKAGIIGGTISYKGIQVSYGMISRKFRISYDQARGIFDYFCKMRYLGKWQPPMQRDIFKNRGNYYQLLYRP